LMSNDRGLGLWVVGCGCVLMSRLSVSWFDIHVYV
jgi:hypothetical protein